MREPARNQMLGGLAAAAVAILGPGAASTSAGVCGEGSGSCCDDTGSAGCDDVRCCELVCKTDPFCCNVEWDFICASQALDLCAVCCDGDLDGDGLVDGTDLGIVLAAFGTEGPGDLDGSGLVDGKDLGLLLAAWGPCKK